MERTFDCLVIGAGYAGAVVARELAERGGKRVLVLERRDHIGGNAYDCLDESGILIHRYGPHIFHTSDQRVYSYLSRFTQWRDYQHRVLANVYGRYMPVPFNLSSLHMAFPGEKGPRLEEKLLSAYGEGARVTILSLREASDPEIREVAVQCLELLRGVSPELFEDFTVTTLRDGSSMATSPYVADM